MLFKNIIDYFFLEIILNLRGVSEESHGKSKSQYPVFRPGFETVTFRL
jgi:hypothetical protein